MTAAPRRNESQRVLILIPAFNEAGRIEKVIQGLLDLREDFDVVVIDDGSSDHTRQAAIAMGATVLRHPVNLGYGAALQTGYIYAQRHGYQQLVQMDADGQHDPESVPVLLAELDRARTQPFSEAEVAQARAISVGGFALALESSSAVLGALVDLDLYALPEDSLDTYRSRIRSVSASEVTRMAAQIIHPGRIAIILVGPAEALKPQLQGLGPIEVVDP